MIGRASNKRGPLRGHVDRVQRNVSNRRAIERAMDFGTFLARIRIRLSSIGYIGTVTDITSQRNSEDARNRSEAESRAILDAAVDAIATIDEAGTVLSFNRAAQKMFGYTSDEVIGRNVNMLMPEAAPRRPRWLPHRLSQHRTRTHHRYRARTRGAPQGRLPAADPSRGQRGHRPRPAHVHRHHARHLARTSRPGRDPPPERTPQCHRQERADGHRHVSIRRIVRIDQSRLRIDDRIHGSRARTARICEVDAPRRSRRTRTPDR